MFTILLIGNTNVGKTSLFNKLTGTNLAIDNKINNFTYDFNYALSSFKNKYFICIDSFNINFLKKNKNDVKNNSEIKCYSIYKKFLNIIKNIDLICLLVDYTIGINQNDVFWSNFFFKKKKKIVLLINKIDLCKDYYLNLYSYYSLGINLIYPISIYNNKSILFFLNDIFFKKKIFVKENMFFFKKIIFFCINLDKYNSYLNILYYKKYFYDFIKIVILGKPNVGKSTLMNFIVNCKRSVVSNISGTTKDFITCFINIKNMNYIISDSPGLDKFTEKFFIKNKKIFLNKIFDFKIIFYLIDIYVGITKYDLVLLNFFLKCGKMVVLIFNKCEFFTKFQINNYKNIILSKYDFVKYLDIYFISAINLNKNYLLNFLDKLVINYKNVFLKKINSYKLTKILKKSIDKFYDENNIKKIVKLKYAHIGGYFPLTIIIHGNKINFLSVTYKKYLMNFYIKKLKIKGCKIFLKFKEIYNPFKKNKY